MPLKSQQFRVIQFLARRATARLNQRRGYEWKMCFSLWTALGLAIGFVISSRDIHPSLGLALVVIAASGIILWTFQGWTNGIAKNNALDKETSLWCEKRLMEENQIEQPSMLDPRAYIEAPPKYDDTKWDKRWRHWGHWSHGAQLQITATLLALFVATVLLKMYSFEAPDKMSTHIEMDAATASSISIAPATVPSH